MVADSRRVGTVRPRDGVADGLRDGVGDGLGDGVADGLRDGVGDGLRDGVGDGLRDGVGDGLRVGVADGLRDGVADGLRVGVADGLRDGVGDRLRVGVGDGLRPRLRHRRRRHKMKSVGARGARKSASDTVEVAMVATFTLAAAVIAKIAMAAAIPSTPAAQAPRSEQPVVPATVALVETWPDGRINYELTSPRRANMWTPRFPRVDGYALPEGAQPVFAVQFARVLVGRDIRVEVSVLLGSATPPGVPVATVLVSPGSRVVVEELTKFGVQPVTLSMVNVAPMTPYLPTAISVSPQIEIANVELLTAPYPGYRVTLRNLGTQAVSNVSVQSYRGGEKALSALKRTDDGRPMMQPGERYTFDLNL